MTNSKSTRRALLTSALAILMCVVMLVGTTFAWFTDTASTAVNKIQAGNLKMKVSYKNNTDGEFAPVNEETKVFNESALWEPGHVEFVVLNVKNVGTLALKYKLGINIAGETGSTNVLGNEFKLSDYIKFAVVEGDKSGLERADLVAAAETAGSKLIKEGYTSDETALKAASDADEALQTEKTVTLVVWMPESVDNSANHATDADAPVINLGINVLATQYTHESDSFGIDYDAGAQYADVTYSHASNQEALDEALAAPTDPEKPAYIGLAPGEYALNSTHAIKAGTTLVGKGVDSTTLNANKLKVTESDVTLKDVTIKGSGSAGTAGTLNINGNNTTMENVNYEGDGNIAITVSTGAQNEGTTFKKTTIKNAFRGIQFWSLSGDSLIDDCILDVAGYTFNIDAAVAGSTLTIRNSTLNGWTSYTNGIKLVSFEGCKLGLNAYEYLRPYSETKLTNCDFTSAGYTMNAGGTGAYTITLTDCTKNGTPITAENVVSLLLDTDGWNTNVTLIVNNTVVTVG